MSGDGIYWRHSDPRGLDAGAAAASARASLGAWGSDTTSVADLRALLAGWTLQASDLADGVHRDAQGALTARSFPVTGERATWAGALLRTVAILAAGERATASIDTLGGGAANLADASDDAEARADLSANLNAAGFGTGTLVVLGLGPLVPLLGPFLVAAALFPAPEADTRKAKLIALTDQVARVLDAHRQRERAAGKRLSFTATERQQLDTLVAAQRQIAIDMGRTDLAPSAQSPLGFLKDLITPVAEGVGAGIKWSLIGLTAALALWAYVETRQ